VPKKTGGKNPKIIKKQPGPFVVDYRGVSQARGKGLPQACCTRLQAPRPSSSHMASLPRG